MKKSELICLAAEAIIRGELPNVSTKIMKEAIALAELMKDIGADKNV